VIDAKRIRRLLERERLGAWADRIEAQLGQVLEKAPHGDWAAWRQAIDSLPALGAGCVHADDGALTLSPSDGLAATERQALRSALQALHPWRKGPYRIAGLLIDAEWRSDWKWQRVRPHLAALDDRLVLDVGCGNGYHCWRLAQAGARRVIGIDPTALFVAQFLAIRRLLAPLDPALAEGVELLPLGIEALPPGLGRFDTVLSMGVLYHRRSPLDHLTELRGALRPGGQLVLETLVIEGGADQVLVPPGRYAKMRNVWFIPTTALLRTWLERCGFRSVEIVDVTTTSLDEQRATAWMRFESLADFLDPADMSLTIEGHPAPRRAVLIAEA
jgi:tRNA (mo5U34)-methyltransferase